MGFMEWFGRKNNTTKGNSVSSSVHRPLTDEERRFSLTAEELEAFEWGIFAQRLKQEGLIPEQFSFVPQKKYKPIVSIDRGLPRMDLEFVSDVDKKKMTLSIVGSSVMISDEKHVYDVSEPISRVWQEMTKREPEHEIRSVFDSPVM